MAIAVKLVIVKHRPIPNIVENEVEMLAATPTHRHYTDRRRFRK
jgi:hypothetical protein